MFLIKRPGLLCCLWPVFGHIWATTAVRSAIAMKSLIILFEALIIGLSDLPLPRGRSFIQWRQNSDLPVIPSADELVHVPLVRCSALMIPSDISPDTMTGCCDDLHDCPCNPDSLVLVKSTGKELFGLVGIGYRDSQFRKLDQRRHRVEIRDSLRITIEQGTGISVKNSRAMLYALINSTLCPQRQVKRFFTYRRPPPAPRLRCPQAALLIYPRRNSAGGTPYLARNSLVK